MTKQVYDEEGILFDYTGRDVRAIHVLPPVVAPDLIHDPANLIPLCWECLFGSDERPLEDDPASLGWKDESPLDRVEAFAPLLADEYRAVMLNEWRDLSSHRFHVLERVL